MKTYINGIFLDLWNLFVYIDDIKNEVLVYIIKNPNVSQINIKEWLLNRKRCLYTYLI